MFFLTLFEMCRAVAGIYFQSKNFSIPFYQPNRMVILFSLSFFSILFFFVKFVSLSFETDTTNSSKFGYGTDSVFRVTSGRRCCYVAICEKSKEDHAEKEEDKGDEAASELVHACIQLSRDHSLRSFGFCLIPCE